MPYAGERVIIIVAGWTVQAVYVRHDPVKWGDHPHVVEVLRKDGTRGQRYAVRSVARAGCAPEEAMAYGLTA